MKERLLTKSRYKLASECPTKLFFTGKAEFGNNNLDNAFLNALASGGFQVGELAKLYFPGGTMVATLDYDQSLAETHALLQNENVIIYEAAFRYLDFFVRVDILKKSGTFIELIEVKSKSFDETEENPFRYKRKKGLNLTWAPYLKDVAFQKYVVSKSTPDTTVEASLLMSGKNRACTVEGLNQKFFLAKGADGRPKVEVDSELTTADVCREILVKINVDDEISMIWDGLDRVPTRQERGLPSFEEEAVKFSADYKADSFIPSAIESAPCKKCEFRIPLDQILNGYKSGFEKCWTLAFERMGQSVTEAQLRSPKVIDLWKFRDSAELMAQRKFFLSDLVEEDIVIKKSDVPGLSDTQRQWLQVEKSVGFHGPHVDVVGLQNVYSTFTFPLHFIDFETTTVALPFTKGRRPYEQVAFQFSHHMVHQDGKIEHAGEFISDRPGVFPNFTFVRELKRQLEGDSGTIFRYAAHENTVLCQIYAQLSNSAESEVADKQELMDFIREITRSTGGAQEKWEGKRNMVDMLELVKSYYYHPLTQGSNSIKKVLPAILSEKSDGTGRFSKNTYGAKGGIPSHNFKNWAWIKYEGGKLVDPYKLLPGVFDDLGEHEEQLLLNPVTDDDLATGGAAMTAYAKMQFTQMTDLERQRVRSALLKYCELDTFAMVLIYEYWRDIITNANAQDAKGA